MRGMAAALCLWLGGVALGQEDAIPGGGADRLRFEYVHYRPAVWEEEALREKENERPNRGGLIYAYFTNVSPEPLRLQYWRFNDRDESWYILGGYASWHRNYRTTLRPGEMGVLEIDGVSEDFARGTDYTLEYIGGDWKPAGKTAGRLEADPVRVSFIRVMPGMRELEVHVRHRGEGPVAFGPLDLVGRGVAATEWRGERVEGRLEGWAHAIASVRLEKPLEPAELILLRLEVQEGDRRRSVYAHRRAFVDAFPIGVWTAPEESLGLLRRHHVDTVVEGGGPTNPFFAAHAARYEMRAMVPTGVPVDVDTVRGLGDHEANLCWMLTDEPDWRIQASTMLLCDDTVRRYNRSRPTFMTLCRNVKFFEYAPIADIPCMDHYCVTAPTSSVWPAEWGTKLEETGYYTRDLKEASEPKPIWVWSQAIAPWTERPKRPVPTPDELAAQLLYNVGNGAKGIIWFNYDPAVAERYPDVLKAMGRWGRVLRLLREDLLAADPLAPATDPAHLPPLAAKDRAIVAYVNGDYDMDDAGYVFRARRDVRRAFPRAALPWIEPRAAFAVEPDGVRPVPFRVTDDSVQVELGDVKVGRVVVLANDPGAQIEYEKRYAEILQDEQRAFEGEAP